MQLRFLETLPSSNPGYPFQPGQTISLPRLSAEMQRWVREGRAELLKDEPEQTVEIAPERAVTQRSKGKR